MIRPLPAPGVATVTRGVLHRTAHTTCATNRRSRAWPSAKSDASTGVACHSTAPEDTNHARAAAVAAEEPQPCVAATVETVWRTALSAAASAQDPITAVDGLHVLIAMHGRPGASDTPNTDPSRGTTATTA